MSTQNPGFLSVANPFRQMPYDPGNRFRVRRFSLFKKLTDGILQGRDTCKVLDIGGTIDYWLSFATQLDFQRVQVTVVNIDGGNAAHNNIEFLPGDGRSLPNLDDNSFDIVHSNSVIEHVGRWQDMCSMAKEVRRLAQSYFVQTPYYWFPIEPHARFLALHWIPEALRCRIVMKRTCGYWQRQEDLGEAMKTIQSAVLLDKRQMTYLFPEATIISEKFCGLTKSLIAVR